MCWYVLGVGEVAVAVEHRIEAFKPYIPLIQGLRNPGMRQRHWDMVSGIPDLLGHKHQNITDSTGLMFPVLGH